MRKGPRRLSARRSVSRGPHDRDLQQGVRVRERVPREDGGHGRRGSPVEFHPRRDAVADPQLAVAEN
jgi:hypothetical protein